MPTLLFKLEGVEHQIELSPDLAPVTIGKLLSTLPAELDIHCAKIAGQHIFWHAPVIADLEKAQDILTLPAGTFLYWPERQFLELIYGELQAEKAQVSVLGCLVGDVGWLKEYGARVVASHGHQILSAQLLVGQGCAGLALPETSTSHVGLADLRLARKAIWASPPQELFTLLRRDGMMLPYGPLAMAEGELRKLHELLWRLRSVRFGIATTERSAVVRFLIDAFNARIDGFCGLHSIGAVLDASKALFDEPAIAPAALEELILYAGRASAWLDGYIPWNALNEVTINSLGAQRIR